MEEVSRVRPGSLVMVHTSRVNWSSDGREDDTNAGNPTLQALPSLQSPSFIHTVVFSVRSPTLVDMSSSVHAPVPAGEKIVSSSGRASQIVLSLGQRGETISRATAVPSVTEALAPVPVGLINVLCCGRISLVNDNTLPRGDTVLLATVPFGENIVLSSGRSRDNVDNPVIIMKRFGLHVGNGAGSTSVLHERKLYRVSGQVTPHARNFRTGKGMTAPASARFCTADETRWKPIRFVKQGGHSSEHVDHSNPIHTHATSRTGQGLPHS